MRRRRAVAWHLASSAREHKAERRGTDAILVFGSGLAIVPFLYGGVVGSFHWLTEQFLDAVAVAMITPGPVVIPAAYFRRSVNDRRLKAFVDGVTAAATGAIAGAAIVLGRRSLVDAPTIAIGLATVLILSYVERIPEPLVNLTAGLIGLGLKGVVGP
jgi:chromate transporter